MGFLKAIFTQLDKDGVIANIRNEVQYTFEYFVLLVLSVIIATLGLIINNSVIIIGAMLMSPMVWPIIGLAISTVMRDKKLLNRSFLLLGLSLLVTVFVAFLLSLVSPFELAGSEILSRTNPTLFDLVIALAAGFAAAFILSWERYSNAIAGVAIAAAILPPICVAGISLAFSHYDYAWGSFILFLTNLSSIVFAGIIVFTSLKFYHFEKKKERIRRIGVGVLLSSLIILGLGVELFFSLRQIVFENNVRQLSRVVLERELTDLSNDIRINGLTLVAERDAGLVSIEADVATPSDIIITIADKNSVIDALEEELDARINLQLRIVQVVEAFSPDAGEVEARTLRKNIETLVYDQIQSVSEAIQLQSINIVQNKEFGQSNVDLVLRVPEGLDIGLDFRDQLGRIIADETGSQAQVEVTILRYYAISEAGVGAKVREDIRSYIAEHPQYPSISAQKIEIINEENKVVVDIGLSIPTRMQSQEDNYRGDLVKFINTLEFGEQSKQVIIRFFQYD